MLSLPENERRFVEALFQDPKSWAGAARAAGHKGTPSDLQDIGWQLARTDRILEAIKEEDARETVVQVPHVGMAMRTILEDPLAKGSDKIKAAGIQAQRAGVGMKTEVTITHKRSTDDAEMTKRIAMKLLGMGQDPKALLGYSTTIDLTAEDITPEREPLAVAYSPEDF